MRASAPGVVSASNIRLTLSSPSRLAFQMSVPRRVVWGGSATSCR